LDSVTGVKNIDKPTNNEGMEELYIKRTSHLLGRRQTNPFKSRNSKGGDGKHARPEILALPRAQKK